MYVVSAFVRLRHSQIRLASSADGSMRQGRYSLQHADRYGTCTTISEQLRGSGLRTHSSTIALPPRISLRMRACSNAFSQLFRFNSDTCSATQHVSSYLAHEGGPRTAPRARIFHPPKLNTGEQTQCGLGVRINDLLLHELEGC